MRTPVAALWCWLRRDAGANFGNDDRDGSALLGGPTPGAAHLYIEGNRLFRTKKPIIAAVHGAAVGGGLDLAMVADFRVTCAEARFSANFTRLGFHPGFGLTVTLPAVIGQTKCFIPAALSPATKLSPWVLPICWCRRNSCAATARSEFHRPLGERQQSRLRRYRD
jgi:Enoyl-CoA hydratase/isomerase